MVVIKGVNVFITAVDTVINKYLFSLTGIFQVLLSKQDPIEEILIKIEIKENICNVEGLITNILRDFKENIFITPKIEICVEGSLPRYEGKTKNILRIL